MSAAVVLPVLWAFAERLSEQPETESISERKGPHSLRLVRACEQAPALRTAGQVNPPAQQLPAAQRKAPAPQLAFYRKYTEAMLRRYEVLSMEAGRVPSLLGRELFRGNVTHYKVTSFEDVVIYVHDVENCIARLDPGQQHLIRRIALQGYTQEETSALLGITLRTVIRRYWGALDRLTRIFLRLGMLQLHRNDATGSITSPE